MKAVLSLALGFALALIAASAASAQSCGDFYVQRNQIYKNNGYCFNTPRGINTFGNAGCQYDNVNDVPLSNRDRAIVAEITREERMMGCR